VHCRDATTFDQYTTTCEEAAATADRIPMDADAALSKEPFRPWEKHISYTEHNKLEEQISVHIKQHHRISFREVISIIHPVSSTIIN
jgi:hypothetical protein